MRPAGLPTLALVLLVAPAAAPALALAPSVAQAGGPLTRKVLFIGVDGVRPDALEVAYTPNIDTLIADGSYSAVAQAGPLTFSGPGWSNQLCGVWGDKHTVTTNGFGGNSLARYPNFLALLESALADVDTSAHVTWAALRDYLVGGADHVFFQNYTQGGDVAATMDAADRLANHDPDAMFLYYAGPDAAGHGCCFSPTSADYLAAIEEVDDLIGVVLQALRGRASYPQEDWLILLCSDHGGIGTGHSGGLPEQRTVPFIASGPSVPKGVLFPVPAHVDVAASAMAHLGVVFDPAWEIDGRALGPAAPTHLGSNLIFNGDAEHSTGNASFAPDRGISGWRDIGALTLIAWDSGQGFPASSDPGPPDRGANFFSGGAGIQNDQASFTVDVSDVGHWIDPGAVTYRLEGWLGGYAEQEDRMSVTASFLDAVGGVLGSDVIGPVTLAQRVSEIGGTGAQLTGLLFRDAAGHLPNGTRRIRLTLLAEHFEGGGTDGYGDSLSLVLGLDPGFDCNLNGVSDARDLEDGVPDECDCLAQSYCATTPSSVGPGGLIRSVGSIRVTHNVFGLRADQVPPNQFGLFFYGGGRAYLPLGEAVLCVGTPLFRLPVVQASPQGVASTWIDLTSPPQPAGRITAGSTWHFQYWYRDAAGAGSPFNLTHGLAVTFCP